MYNAGGTNLRPFPDMEPLYFSACENFSCFILLIILFEKRLDLRGFEALHKKFTSS